MAAGAEGAEMAIHERAGPGFLHPGLTHPKGCSAPPGKQADSPGLHSWPSWPKGCSVPSAMALSCKNWSRREEGGRLWLWHLSCTSWATCMLSPAFREAVGHLHAERKLWISSFFPFCWGTQLLLSLLNCCYPHPQVSSPSFSLLCILWEQKVTAPLDEDLTVHQGEPPVGEQVSCCH